MATIKAEEVRIPRRARQAVAHHEEVVVLNRERPAFVIVHPDDYGQKTPTRRGRPLRDALAALAQAAPPDPGFAEDMEAVLDSVGTVPADPWAPS
jgi:PHD/YefM family antitoxin component YafN of YafNO toxin-antitoxin module